MPHFICTTCGTQYADNEAPPPACAICQDQRQYVGWDGQQWITHDEFRPKYSNLTEPHEPEMMGIGIEPTFAIGQRAFLFKASTGNILWDCLPLLDDTLTEYVNALGGISAIAISHPHYYSSMVRWSRVFDCPVFLHAADKQWVMRPDPAIEFWDGETNKIADDATLIRCGGHFDGGTVLHWAAGADGRGALLSGDIIQVVQDRRWVSFMYSYPNLIPLSAAKVRRIVAAVEPFEFDRVYGAFAGKVVERDGKEAVRRSAQRYLEALEAG